MYKKRASRFGRSPDARNLISNVFRLAEEFSSRILEAKINASPCPPIVSKKSEAQEDLKSGFKRTVEGAVILAHQATRLS